jgi:hypothetical protein
MADSAQHPPAFETHVVSNQPPPFAGRDLWVDDVVLREALGREGGAAFAGQVATYGALAGGELYRLGFDANRDRPRLRTHDAQGHRIDQVEFHPAYHQLMAAAKTHGVPACRGSTRRSPVHMWPVPRSATCTTRPRRVPAARSP